MSNPLPFAVTNIINNFCALSSVEQQVVVDALKLIQSGMPKYNVLVSLGATKREPFNSSPYSSDEHDKQDYLDSCATAFDQH